MTLQGKGFFIWKIPNCEGGSPTAIAATAESAGLTHVLLKIADGTHAYNTSSSGADLVGPVVQALHNLGIQAWGWHYVYGDDPVGEAQIAIQRIKGTKIDGYVMDVEGEYKDSGKDLAARTFMNELRSAYPSLPMALSSYRYPSYHPQIPWREFLLKCTYNMPQVYWEQAHNPKTQLERCVSEFRAIDPYRPIIPTGPTYKWNGWSPTESDITEFLNTAKAQGLTAANFFSWDECRRDLNNLWNLIANYSYPGGPTPEDILVQYFTSLNSHDPTRITGLYTPTAVHITASRTVQGTLAIQSWYNTLLTQLLPNATFTMTSSTTIGTSRHFTWQAVSSKGTVTNGNDTIGLVDGRISYHYTYYTIT